VKNSSGLCFAYLFIFDHFSFWPLYSVLRSIAYNKAVQELTGVRKTFLIYLPCM
jgi:hypothetical protein